MNPLTSEHFDEAERLHLAATDAPWKAVHRHVQCNEMHDAQSGLGLEIEGPPDDVNRGQFEKSADARLIAFMRNHGPDAFRELKAARERIAELEKINKRAAEDWADDDTRVKEIAAKFGIRDDDQPGYFKNVIQIAEEMAGKLEAVRKAIELTGYCVRQLLQSLPTKRDWLDPDLEKLMRAAADESAAALREIGEGA